MVFIAYPLLTSLLTVNHITVTNQPYYKKQSPLSIIIKM